MKDVNAYLKDIERLEAKELKRTHKRKYERLETISQGKPKAPKKGK
jgi:hypothetical protein